MPEGALGLIAARGLTLVRDGRTVFRDVDFDAPAGAVTAVLRPSGIGKTSLLRCLVRLEAPAEGRVLLEGADVRELDATTLRRAVGLVAQAPVAEGLPAIEARLALGVPAAVALAPTVRAAVATGMIPVVDQTRSVGLVALPGTFVGLILGGASPGEAARVQLVVLLALLGVELIAALVAATLLARGLTRPGERVVAPGR